MAKGTKRLLRLGYSYHHARSREKFEFSLPFVLNDGLWEKSTNLLKQFRLTALVSQSVEQFCFCLARKTIFQIFHNFMHGDMNNPDELLNQRRLYFQIQKKIFNWLSVGIGFLPLGLSKLRNKEIFDTISPYVVMTSCW